MHHPPPPSAALLSDDSNSQPPVADQEQQQMQFDLDLEAPVDDIGFGDADGTSAPVGSVYSSTRHMNEKASRAKFRDTLLRMLRRTDLLIAAADSQIRQLCRQMEAERVRFDRACARSQRSYRYTLRLRMAVLEGMINMLREYANTKTIERNNFAAIVRVAELELAAAENSPSAFVFRGEAGNH